MKHLILLSALILGISAPMLSQDFLSGSDRFSNKEDAYIYLNDGTEVIGTIKDIDRKKGQIKEITLKINGKKTKYKPEDISHMYLMPSKFNKLTTTFKEGLNINEHDKDKTVDNELITKGYVKFETTEVMQKKKKRTLLVQLVNPHFSKKIRVYHDPFARESASVGVGAFTVAGGQDKSYYVKKGDAVAERVKSKKYKEVAKTLYEDCPDLFRKFDDKKGWSNFSDHVVYYTYECK